MTVAVALILLVATTMVSPAVAQVRTGSPATPAAASVPEERVQAVASQLRCVVCQNLSVADSPSEMAGQMRTLVRERLATGETNEQVIQYFVDRYGEWILLAPRRSGFTLLVWVFPYVAVAVGFVAVGLLLRGWTRRARAVRAATPAVDAAMSERIKREMEGGA